MSSRQAVVAKRAQLEALLNASGIVAVVSTILSATLPFGVMGLLPKDKVGEYYTHLHNVVRLLCWWAALSLISSAVVDGYRLLVIASALQKLHQVADVRLSDGSVVRRQSVQLAGHFMRRCCFNWARVFSAATFVLGLLALFSACMLSLVDSIDSTAIMVAGVAGAGTLLLAAFAFSCLLAWRRIQVCTSVR
jgi:hypothetical protein